MWLDNFFLSNITPLFYIETLADLEKEVKTGRTPEQVVGNLASKTPDASSKCNVHHKALIAAELLGQEEIEMIHGRPIISGGRVLDLEGKTGVIFEPSPEEKAFERWQRGEFLQLERFQAKIWRDELSQINFENIYKMFQRFFLIKRPKNFKDVKEFTDLCINNLDREAVLIFGLSLIGVSQESRIVILERYNVAGKPPLYEFAPYFTYVFSVDLFFYLGIAAGLIGRGRPSHKIDLAYLYYLPFCMIFTSNDKLHSSIVPFFLRKNQSYVLGTELKKDLAKLDAYYSAFPEETKERGVISFAFYPPLDNSFLVTRLWDKHMSSTWRENQIRLKPDPNSKIGKEIMNEMKKFEREGVPVSNERRTSGETDHMVIKRMVCAQKGKWKRFPPEVINRRKNEKGEWEDIKPNSND